MAVKKILIAQAAPKSTATYDALAEKYGVSFDFMPFNRTEPLSSLEMRAQHCNILDYGAVVFSSRSTIDAFFSLSEQLRVKIPETMKYFCTTEMVAMYLQKHIVYRKRKIFFGDGTPASVLALITPKHRDENFLIVTSNSVESSITRAFDETPYRHSGIMFAKSVPLDLKKTDMSSYDLMVLYNKYDIASLKANFPEYRQGDTALVAFGSDSLKKAAVEAGLRIDAGAPSAEFPSAAAAIEHLIINRK